MTADLIRRLEAGETGHKIDWEIYFVLDPAAAAQPLSVAPRYTTSVDAAIAHMVPEGWSYEIAYCTELKRSCVRLMRGGIREDSAGEPTGMAPTAAGAVCAAGLRAREEK